MPGYLFHLGAVMTCSHPPGVAAIPAPKQPRVKIMGMPVAIAGDQILVTGCANTASGGTIPPCTAVTWANMSARVKVMAQPVLLQFPVSGAGNGVCVGAPPPPPIVNSMQPRVQGM